MCGDIGYMIWILMSYKYEYTFMHQCMREGNKIMQHSMCKQTFCCERLGTASSSTLRGRPFDEPSSEDHTVARKTVFEKMLGTTTDDHQRETRVTATSAACVLNMVKHTLTDTYTSTFDVIWLKLRDDIECVKPK